METLQTLEGTCACLGGAPFEQKSYWLAIGIDEIRRILSVANKEMAAILLGVAITVTGNKEAMNAVYTYTLRLSSATDTCFNYLNFLRLIHVQTNYSLADKVFIDGNLITALSFVSDTEKRKLYDEVFAEEIPGDKPLLGIEKENFLRILRTSLGITEA